MKHLFFCILLLSISSLADSAVRSVKNAMHTSGIPQEELDNPCKVIIKVGYKERYIQAVPVKIYFGMLPHQREKQWLIELYDVQKDQRLICSLHQVVWQ